MATSGALEWVDGAFLRFKRQRPADSLGAAFDLAISSAVERRLPERLQEEAMTSLLMGSMISFVDICDAAYGVADTARCAWQFYPKAGSKNGLISEAKSGADFALFVEMEQNLSRVALFQAKRIKSTTPRTVDLHQITAGSETSSGIPQFIRFLDHSMSVGSANGTNVSGAKDVYWAHYLILEASQLSCLALTQLGAVDLAYYSNGACSFEDPGAVDLSKLTEVDLRDLLIAGAALPHGSGQSMGWLDLEGPKAQIDSVKRALVDRFDVFAARPGMGLVPAPDAALISGRPPTKTASVRIFAATAHRNRLAQAATKAKPAKSKPGSGSAGSTKS